LAFYVIGSDELVIGFRFVGVPGMAVHTRDEALAGFREATRSKETLVLIVTEQVASLIPNEVMEWQLAGTYPLIVEIPGIAGHAEDRKSLIDSIREAVGIHV